MHILLVNIQFFHYTKSKSRNLPNLIPLTLSEYNKLKLTVGRQSKANKLVTPNQTPPTFWEILEIIRDNWFQHAYTPMNFVDKFHAQ